MFCCSKTQGKGCWMQGQGREKSEDPAKHQIFQTRLLWGLGTFSSPKLLSFHTCQAGLSKVVVQTSPALRESCELGGKAGIPCQ